MNAIIAEMEALAARLGPPPGRTGRVVQFVAQRSGDGVSSFARAFALAVARTSARGVWLVELDPTSQHQINTFAADPDLYGALGAGVRASPDGSVFFRLSPTGRRSPEQFLIGHAVGARKLWATRFRSELLEAGQRVMIDERDLYWRAMRRHCDVVVVDAPALERSDDALKAARFMDMNIAVLDASRADMASDKALVDALRRAGGNVAGVVLNRAPKSLMRSA
jgi:Mrp family chromosome partitioning ATPase